MKRKYKIVIVFFTACILTFTLEKQADAGSISTIIKLGTEFIFDVIKKSPDEAFEPLTKTFRKTNNLPFYNQKLKHKTFDVDAEILAKKNKVKYSFEEQLLRIVIKPCEKGRLRKAIDEDVNDINVLLGRSKTPVEEWLFQLIVIDKLIDGSIGKLTSGTPVTFGVDFYDKIMKISISECGKTIVYKLGQSPEQINFNERIPN